MADGEADNICLYVRQRTDMPAILKQGDAIIVPFGAVILIGGRGCLSFDLLDLRGDLRKVLRRQCVALTQYGGPEEHVLQLANIARPVMLHQQVQRLAGHAQAANALLPREAAKQMAGEGRDVALAVPQWRHGDMHDVEAVV